KKNRKLRRLRELYPDVRIKLFYARDFRALMLKYGRLGVVDGLSGTLGQVPSHRLVAADAAVATPVNHVAAASDAAAGQPTMPVAAPSPAVDTGDIALAERPVHRSRSARRRRAAAARRSEAALTAPDLALSAHSVFLDGPAAHGAASADR
ncbi:MAG TPA: hypothetical protein VGC90_04495, partial [Candidatus Limnocylindrales bacterium]